MTNETGYHCRTSSTAWRAVCGTLALASVLFAIAIEAPAQQAPVYTVLHTFTGADGEYPIGGVIQGPAGSLYGTTFLGGDFSGCQGAGCGVVFKLDRHGDETVLYSFKGGTDGAAPAMDLLRDRAGNLYGTTHGGGDVGGCTVAGALWPGCGVVFKVDRTGKESTLYAFTGGADGAGPSSGVIQDREGNLYGLTVAGGDLTASCPGSPVAGCGVLFKLDRNGKQTVLHTSPGAQTGTERMETCFVTRRATSTARHRLGATSADFAAIQFLTLSGQSAAERFTSWIGPVSSPCCTPLMELMGVRIRTRGWSGITKATSTA